MVEAQGLKWVANRLVGMSSLSEFGLKVSTVNSKNKIALRCQCFRKKCECTAGELQVDWSEEEILRLIVVLLHIV